ncbi:E3 ubiquitin-protein ligase MARCHF5-like isoform X2 [Artemia franciscana]|uniref:E3 ubiquitin-protein ligase MARCHF5 n=1 Tax=Artemia franciscana TaxID=6661 RepID=A0AA88LEX9_ARTSF|nr:hypothetical protein QYM36_008484 [Artemia franciscana]KAK2728022.1 hypothetical protein QYM36_008484 [Artemia franciscana]
MNHSRARRSCRFCLESSDDDECPDVFVSPCNCKGSAKWVHQSCIMYWIDEKQEGNPDRVVRCSVCLTEYIVVSDYPWYLKVPRRIFGKVENWMQDLWTYSDHSNLIYFRPFLQVYQYLWIWPWSYAAVLQIYGIREGIHVLKHLREDKFRYIVQIFPWAYFIDLINWEEPLSNFLRSYVPVTPILRDIPPFSCFNYRPKHFHLDFLPPYQHPMVRELPFSHVSYLLPMCSVLCGKVIFGSVQGSLKRAMLGGLVYLGLKTPFRLLNLQAEYIDRHSRTVMNRSYVKFLKSQKGT